jgi:DNA-binding transcriptional ArsR family regulator
MKVTETEANQSGINIDKLKTIGNEDRVKILGILIDQGPLSWSKILSILKFNPNSLNFHITKLLYSGFVLREVVANVDDRPSTRYSVTVEGTKYYNLALGKA